MYNKKTSTANCVTSVTLFLEQKVQPSFPFTNANASVDVRRRAPGEDTGFARQHRSRSNPVDDKRAFLSELLVTATW